MLCGETPHSTLREVFYGLLLPNTPVEDASPHRLACPMGCEVAHRHIVCRGGVFYSPGPSRIPTLRTRLPHAYNMILYKKLLTTSRTLVKEDDGGAVNGTAPCAMCPRREVTRDHKPGAKPRGLCRGYWSATMRPGCPTQTCPDRPTSRALSLREFGEDT